MQVEGHINFNIGDLLQIKLFNREKNNAAEMLAFNEISDKLETVLKKLEAVEGYVCFRLGKGSRNLGPHYSIQQSIQTWCILAG